MAEIEGVGDLKVEVSEFQGFKDVEFWKSNCAESRGGPCTEVSSPELANALEDLRANV